MERPAYMPSKRTHCQHPTASEETRRITVWNPSTGKKLSGNAGVFKRNLEKYLRTHPAWVVWREEDRAVLKRTPRQDNGSQWKRKRIEVPVTDGAFNENRDSNRTSLWQSLLEACSSAGSDSDSDGEEAQEEEPGAFEQEWKRRAIPGSSRFAMPTSFVPGGLISPAMG